MRLFSLQFRYCKKSGHCKTIQFMGQDILICTHFIDVCQSALCRAYRAHFSSSSDKAIRRALKDGSA